MTHYNSIDISGYLGTEPETKETRTGKRLISARLGVGQGKDTPTMWLDLTAWGDSPAYAILDGARKGQALGVRGRLSMREWVDQTGTTRQVHGITATDAEMLSEDREAPPRQAQKPYEVRPEPGDPRVDDDADIPFMRRVGAQTTAPTHQKHTDPAHRPAPLPGRSVRGAPRPRDSAASG